MVSRVAALLMLLQLAPIASAARAQFEEPDTVSPIAIGVFGEVFSRGKLGTAETLGGDVDVSLSGGPAIGASFEYRFLETLALDLRASYAAPGEKQKSEASETIASEGFTELRFAAELLLKIKRSVPGYFALGGGARYIAPKSDDPETQFTDIESFTEGFGLLGAGVDVFSRRRLNLRIDFRAYLIVPAEQAKYDVKSLSTDFSLGLGLLYRI
ncbi:MAG: hypothetical protein JSU87_04825 [Gemmatimonadota bacterium]|nr:MAG: hypothetical protein JSU87_04825 [Gemmatimonadota bacterium]